MAQELDRAYLPGGLRAPTPPADVPVRGTVALSVLIVGYRRPDLLAACLTTVRDHLPGRRVLVWENSGPSSALDAVMAAHPDVGWHVSATNIGFAAAVNRLALQADQDDLLLLNPDAVLVGPLHATTALLQQPDVAAAAPRVPNAAPGGRPWDVAHRRATTARALLARSGYAPRLRGTRWSDLYGRAPEDVEGYLTGACLAISRRAWQAVGPFDEEYFLYGEEADWQQRATAAGWRLALAEEVGASHTGHGTVADDARAGQRSRDLLQAGIALNLDRAGARGDVYLAGTAVLDRVQRSARRSRAVARSTRPAVVLTVNRLVFGGAERHHVVLASELRRRGYPVTIACVQRFGPLVADIPLDVRVVRTPWWCPAVDLPAGPAVVIGGDTNTEAGFASLWRAAGRGRRWLVGAHIPPVPDAPTYSHGLAAAMRRADGVVALSPRHRAEMGAHQRVARRWFIAPNGVSPAGLPPPAPPTERSATTPERPLRLVMLSRIVEHKNPHLLVQALEQLADLPWELSIWGDGPDRARLEARTPESLAGRVRWRGWSPGPSAAMAEADLVCLPSTSEAFPLTILEAMTRALPVMAGAVCSVPDMLDQGRAGLLVEPGPSLVAAWAAALRPVLTDPSALPSLGLAGFHRMQQHYTIEAMADAYETAIDAVLTGRG